MAFPAISTGVFGFPREPAARIAAREVRRALEADPRPGRVIFCCFSAADRMLYDRTCEELPG